MIDEQLQRLAAMAEPHRFAQPMMIAAIAETSSPALRETIDRMLAAADEAELLPQEDSLGRLLDIEIVRRVTK